LDSWWDLGEGSGQHGTELNPRIITCPFCLEEGNLTLIHRATKTKANSKKALNFDTLKCGNCAGYVMVLWSAGESWGRGLYDLHVLPWPLRLEKHPDHWPEAVGRYWIQAHRSATDENWDAAAVMARSALQAALRDRDAVGNSLKQEIDDLASRSVLPPHMKAWADELRELGNESAHPKKTSADSLPGDVRDVVKFLDFLLKYLYDLPHEIQKYRGRRGAKSSEV
jgi:hypothetical protein